MKPIDYSTATFANIKERLQGVRADVMSALIAHGPCTTRQLAQRAGMDILTVRPRITELIELGLVDLVQPEASDEADHTSDEPSHRGGREGIYRALEEVEAIQLFNARWEAARRDEQIPLSHLN